MSPGNRMCRTRMLATCPQVVHVMLVEFAMRKLLRWNLSCLSTNQCVYLSAVVAV